MVHVWITLETPLTARKSNGPEAVERQELFFIRTCTICSGPGGLIRAPVLSIKGTYKRDCPWLPTTTFSQTGVTMEGGLSVSRSSMHATWIGSLSVHAVFVGNVGARSHAHT